MLFCYLTFIVCCEMPFECDAVTDLSPFPVPIGIGGGGTGVHSTSSYSKKDSLKTVLEPR